MPKLKNGMPKNCRDRNQAFSWHNGKRIYHGVWGSPEAEKSYKRFLAALIEKPTLPTQVGGGTGVLVSELASAFLDDRGKINTLYLFDMSPDGKYGVCILSSREVTPATYDDAKSCKKALWDKIGLIAIPE